MRCDGNVYVEVNPLEARRLAEKVHKNIGAERKIIEKRLRRTWLVKYKYWSKRWLAWLMINYDEPPSQTAPRWGINSPGGEWVYHVDGHGHQAFEIAEDIINGQPFAAFQTNLLIPARHLKLLKCWACPKKTNKN